VLLPGVTGKGRGSLACKPFYHKEIEKASRPNKTGGVAVFISGKVRCQSKDKESKMLVLSRQKDESIVIGDDVEITIVDVRGDKVRLGISAPKSISVHRKEIYEAIQREKAEKAEVDKAAAEKKA
jgi:carbon storage regulator